MFKKVPYLILILGIIFFVQCSEDHLVPDDLAEKAGGNGNGGNGGNGGNSGNGGNGGNGGSGGLYGDLVICLRTNDGIPVYTEIDGEHGLSYYPTPIKIEDATDYPYEIDGVYQTFDLNVEGEVVPEDGYYVKEVEFGRLNIVRAPQSVLDQALGEAVNSLTQLGVTAIKTDASGRLTAIIGAEDWLVNYDTIPDNDEFDDKTIDSPRENVAIYQELMSYGIGTGGQLAFLANYGYSNLDRLILSYGAIAAGADKTGTMNVDEFAYMNDWLLKWEYDNIIECTGSPDVRGRRYFDYSGFSYSRTAVYADKYVWIRVLYPNGTWEDTYQSLLDVVPWTDPQLLIDYENGNNTNITGFSNAADDAIQVLEFIHESDLVVYSPYFTANGFEPPL